MPHPALQGGIVTIDSRVCAGVTRRSLGRTAAQPSSRCSAASRGAMSLPHSLSPARQFAWRTSRLATISAPCVVEGRAFRGQGFQRFCPAAALLGLASICHARCLTLLHATSQVCYRDDGSLWRLGAGSFGTVFKAVKNGTTPVAVKVRLQSPLLCRWQLHVKIVAATARGKHSPDRPTSVFRSSRLTPQTSSEPILTRRY